LEVKPGYSQLSMTVREDMLNFNGTPHGGAIFSLADEAFGVASNSHGQVAVALNIEISYLRMVEPGTRLIAEAAEEYLGERTALYHITVSTDDEDLVASCHGVVYRRREWFLGP
jgi:acyl-CoA thioesterase